jgi:crossover junction endodeoxyribonuclease RuvC
VRILGVDPGSLRTGWGLLGGTSRQPFLVESGVIRLPAGAGFPERLHRLQIEFEELVRRLAPSEAAVEMPFHGLNARSALQLAHARGVLLAVLGAQGIPMSEYAPAAVKKAVTGNGRADKAQVHAMAARLLGARIDGATGDLTDAVGIALCHAASREFRTALRRVAPVRR